MCVSKWVLYAFAVILKADDTYVQLVCIELVFIVLRVINDITIDFL